jgi:D-alanyl-D-alanine carboxypeptidase/D-alanyl-D-alanine-endopeptidase (penicillin-binding protein 4)
VAPRGARARRRAGPGPLIVLAVVAVVPALGLLALFRWSDDRVDDNEAAPPPPSTVLAPGQAPPPLVDDVMSYRRFPSTISRGASVATFQTELVPFLGSINDRSCVAVSVDGVPIGTQHADLSVIPASNVKIVVAAVALEELGPDFRYRTVVSADADPVDGVIDGDLHLVGGGDPLLSSDWYPTSNLERYPVRAPTSLDALADQVVAAGVTTVRGGVVGDGSRYDDEFFAPGWGTGVAGLEAGPYDALLVNDGRVLGDELRANDPNEGGAREFARLLVERGVDIGGGARAGTAPEAAVEIASIESAPLPSVIDEMLKNSDNNTAELLVKEIGLAAAGSGTRQAGLDAMSARLAAWGVPTEGVVLADGSGLSLDNRLRCDTLLAVIQRGEPDEPVAAGLAVAGESGTLNDLFVGHPLEGRLRGKTGTLNNPPFNEDPPAVKALAGIVPVDGGGAIEYALILNGPTISDQSEYRPIWDDFADVLATYPAGPTPAELAPRR